VDCYLIFAIWTSLCKCDLIKQFFYILNAIPILRLMMQFTSIRVLYKPTANIFEACTYSARYPTRLLFFKLIIKSSITLTIYLIISLMINITVNYVTQSQLFRKNRVSFFHMVIFRKLFPQASINERLIGVCIEN
jgi:hypothetical protein